MEIPINYSAVVVAAIVAFAIGGMWYGPLFGKQWMRLVGLTKESIKTMRMTPAMAMGGMFIGTLLMAYVLAHGIIFGNAYLGAGGVEGALMGAFWYWLGFAVPLTATAFLFEGKSIKLWVLNAGYYLVSLLVMGAILGSWV